MVMNTMLVLNCLSDDGSYSVNNIDIGRFMNLYSYNNPFEGDIIASAEALLGSQRNQVEDIIQYGDEFQNLISNFDAVGELNIPSQEQNLPTNASGEDNVAHVFGDTVDTLPPLDTTNSDIY